MFLCAGVVVLAGSGTWWYTHRARTGSPTPGDAFTIYLLGSSTAYGFPYDSRIDLGKLVSPLLGGSIQGRPIAVVNLALPGRTAREILGDARDLLDRAPMPDRSLVFVYPGNNEFARLDRRPDLGWHERTLFDSPVVSEEERATIEAGYGPALSETFRTLQEAGLAVVASTIVVNLKDWDPNRSILGDRAHEASVRSHLATGQQTLDAGDPAAALAHFKAILSVEPYFALASKRAGDCCRALGRLAEARQYFRNAIDDDGYPLRDTSGLDAMLRRACAERRVPLLDAAAVLNAASPDSILGFELLWDNCHPTFAGYAHIARALATIIGSRYGAAPDMLPDSTLRRAVGLDADLEQAALHREGQYCYTAATFTFDPRPKLARARHYLERADAMGPDANVVCSLAVLAGLEGHLDPSLAQWRRAMQLDPEVTRERMKNRYAAQIMHNLGVKDLARAIE